MNEVNEGIRSQLAHIEVINIPESSKRSGWENLFGENILEKYGYQPQPRSVVGPDGYSIVDNSTIYGHAIMTPLLEKEPTEEIVKLNKIVSTEKTYKSVRSSSNWDPKRLNWEANNHIAVYKVQELIRNGHFDMTKSVGWGRELPGGYIMLTDGSHRMTGMFLEGVSEVKMKVQKMIPGQFRVTDKYENLLHQFVKKGIIKGSFSTDKYGIIITINNPEITSPVQLLDNIPNPLIDVLSQTIK